MKLYIFRCRTRPRMYGATRYETGSNLPLHQCSAGWEFSERIDLSPRGRLRFAVDTDTVRRQVELRGWHVWDESPFESKVEAERKPPVQEPKPPVKEAARAPLEQKAANSWNQPDAAKTVADTPPVEPPKTQTTEPQRQSAVASSSPRHEPLPARAAAAPSEPPRKPVEPVKTQTTEPQRQTTAAASPRREPIPARASAVPSEPPRKPVEPVKTQTTEPQRQSAVASSSPRHEPLPARAAAAPPEPPRKPVEPVKTQTTEPQRQTTAAASPPREPIPTRAAAVPTEPLRSPVEPDKKDSTPKPTAAAPSLRREVPPPRATPTVPDVSDVAVQPAPKEGNTSASRIPTRNQVVWFDIPVRDIDRAMRFYSVVLGKPLKKEQAGPGAAMAVLPYAEGSVGGSLIQSLDAKPSDTGPLLYLNAQGRIDEVLRTVAIFGGKVIAEKHSIAPFGYRAIILDSEGNRIALHSM